MGSGWLERRFGRKPASSEERARDYAACFSSPEGRRVLADLAERSGLLTGIATIHGDGLMAALETARLEGRRGVVLDILHLLGWTPGRLVVEDEHE